MEQIVKFLKGAGIVLVDGVLAGLEEVVRNEKESIRLNQRDRDIHSAILCLLENKSTKADDIRSLLHKYFGVDSISEADKYIKEARIQFQYIKLQGYLGLDGAEWVKYKREFDVVRKLDSNEKLLELSVEKLKDAIEKK